MASPQQGPGVPIPPPSEGRMTISEVPPATSTPLRQYGNYQDEGAIRQRWVEDVTDDTCQIQPSTLTVADLISDGWYIKSSKHGAPFTIAQNVHALGYPAELVFSQILARKVGHGPYGDLDDENVYDMIFGEGIMIAEGIFRCDGPQFSEVARALFQEVAEPQTLRYFYACDIVNANTRRFVQEMLYTSRNNLEWPPGYEAPRIWHYNTPEYQGILGTRIGKCAAYLVLEIFPRGTRYIARIMTWDHACSIQMRFDIEPIPASAGSA
ncbi:hypothetical protein N7475_001089 [Penicillium sp. IBT 31633x]|nr:hypothetical protein N7475_001089 [Penicillium sp. IBT 31633x]